MVNGEFIIIIAYWPRRRRRRIPGIGRYPMGPTNRFQKPASKGGQPSSTLFELCSHVQM